MRLGPDLGARQLLDVTEATVRKDIPTTQYKLAKLLKVDSVAGPIIAQHGRQPGTLIIDDGDLADWPHHAIVRIHGTLGPNALPLARASTFRADRQPFRPVPTADPHPPRLRGQLQRRHHGHCPGRSVPTRPDHRAVCAEQLLPDDLGNRGDASILLDLRGTWPITGPAQRIGYAVT